MNIYKKTKEFHDFEVNNKLFEAKDSTGLKYWDIVRYDIYNLLFRDFQQPQSAQLVKKYKISKYFKYFNKLIKFLSTFAKAVFFRKKYLFFVASRTNKNGQIVDVVSEKYIEILSADSFVLETFSDKALPGRHFFRIPNLSKFFKSDKFFSISTHLVKSYGTDINFNKEIEKRVKKFKNDYFFYKLLFFLARPKVIFMVQNGIQKAMFKAANDLNIPIVEFQHGYIGYVHQAYSYPDEISSLMIKEYLPSYFFTFSDFWSKNINFPTKTVSIGGNFNSFLPISTRSNGIVIVSADIYHDLLKTIAIELANDFKDRNIIYKLHPNQSYDYQTIQAEFAQYKNIKTILNEKNLNDIFSENLNVVLIQSTAVYEALQNKNRVFIYKRADYHTHQDVFDFVQLFDDYKALKNLINNYSDENQTDMVQSFFEPFDKDKFMMILKEIENP